MPHDFCRLQNIDDFRSQRNSAAEWSRNVLTVSKCERSRTGSKWNQWISLLNLWVRRYIYFQCIFFFVRFFKCWKYFTSIIRSTSRVFCLAFDLQQCEMIYSLFRWHAAHLSVMFHLHQVYASLYLDRGRITVPWRSQELYFAKWLIKHGFI